MPLPPTLYGHTSNNGGHVDRVLVCHDVGVGRLDQLQPADAELLMVVIHVLLRLAQVVLALISSDCKECPFVKHNLSFDCFHPRAFSCRTWGTNLHGKAL